MTELDLVRQGSQLLQIPLEQLVRSGAILLAKREILTRTKYLGASGAGGGGEAQSPELPRSGVAGSADNRIKEAFEFLLKAGKEVAPARLAKLSRTNFNSAHRWIQLNHPQLLLNKTLRPRQARPIREKPPAAAQQESSTPPSPPPPQKEETVKATAPATPALKPQAAKQRKTKTTSATDSKPQANSPEPIVFNDLKLSSSHTIKLAYGAVNQRGSAFLSVDPFGKAALDEALRAHQLDSTSFGHVELIPYKPTTTRAITSFPVVWLMLLLPNHQPFLEKNDREIYRTFKKPSLRGKE